MEQLNHIDLLEDGYTVKRKIDNLYLYRKQDKVIVAKVKSDGELEILIKLNILDDERRTKVLPYN
jgi:hypothetical protein